MVTCVCDLCSVPCANGTCSSPAEVVAVYAHGNGILPQDLAKALLYPGALLHTVEGAVADGESVQWPSGNSLLNNFFNTGKSNSQIQAPVNVGFVMGCISVWWVGSFPCLAHQCSLLWAWWWLSIMSTQEVVKRTISSWCPCLHWQCSAHLVGLVLICSLKEESCSSGHLPEAWWENNYNISSFRPD